MREIADTLRRWQRERQAYGLATVVGVRGSAPRDPGAVMAVDGDGEAVGSVSGGCVEGAVYDLARRVLETGTALLATYGITDEDAYAVGLTCGGILDVLVQPVYPDDAVALHALQALESNAPAALAIVIAGPGSLGARLLVRPADTDRDPTPSTVGSLGSHGLDVAVTDDARGLLAQGLTAVRHYGSSGERRLDDVSVFVHSFAPPPRMLVFGAIDFAGAVARLGVYLGYHVTVCDARPVFATPKRFPEAHEVVCAWPHKYLRETSVDGRTVICVITHDPKFDVPVLKVALRGAAAYIGAMGSRRTHHDRLARLRDAGLTDAELGRLHSPIGLDIGARTPEETAVSIAAEIIHSRWGGSGRPLAATEGTIHRHLDRAAT